MLKILRDNLKYLSWILWVVILVFIAFVFVDFGGGLQRGSGAQSAAAWVGDQEVSRKEFEREYRALEQRYRQAFGGQWNSEMAERMQLPVQALEQLVDRKLLAVEAAENGIAVGDDDVRKAILELDGLKDESGAFVGEEGYRQALRSIGLTTREFEDQIREELAIGRLRTLLETSVTISDAEVEARWRDANEKASIRYLVAPTANFQAQAAPSAAEVESYFAAHTDQFRLPDQRIVDYLLVDAVALRAGVAVERAELERDYAQRRAEFERPEQVRARHILVKVDDNRSAEEAAKRIAQAQARLAKGEAFEKLAAEYSDDPGSKDRGGDLGEFGRGAMVPEFDQAAFGATPGKVVGPVETAFGLHLIEVVSKSPARVRSFEEVESELRARLAQSKAQQLAESRAKELAAKVAREKPQGDEGWKALADGSTVLFLTTPAFGAGEPVPGIGRSAEFAAAAFALEPGAVSAPVEVPRGWAVLRLKEAKPARTPTLAEVEPRVRAAAQRAKANELARARLESAKRELAAGESLAQVAKELGAEVKESGEFTRSGSIAGLGAAREVADAALALAPGAVGGPIVVPQGAILFELVTKSGFDAAKFASERETTRAEIRREETARLEGAVLRKRREELGVRYDPDLAQRLNLAGAKES
jgi:peptidyl-prolyl cis-trans isomerase D